MLPRRLCAKARFGFSARAASISVLARSRSFSYDAANADTHRASGSFGSFSTACRAYSLAICNERILGPAVLVIEHVGEAQANIGHRIVGIVFQRLLE